MTLVDRTVSPVLHLDYGIPFEDTDIRPYEVPTSRTHQFFAFCRPHSPWDQLPRWVYRADVDIAVAAGLVEWQYIFDSDVLELADDWRGCWSSIGPLPQRHSITCASADAGIDWDTSTLAAGAYTLDGYTHQPPFNVFWQRPGVIKVHDGDPDAVGPAAAVFGDVSLVYRDQVARFTGCADALDGTTYRVALAIADGGGVPHPWQVLPDEHPLIGDTFEFELQPVGELLGTSAMVRVDLTDPLGRTYTAFASDMLLVVDADDPGELPATSGTGAESGDSSSSGASTSSGDADSGPMEIPTLSDEIPGCGCRDGADAPSAAIVVLLPVLATARRRRPVV